MKSVNLLAIFGLLAASVAGCGGASVASQSGPVSELEKLRTELETTRAQLKAATSSDTKPHLAVNLATVRKFLEAPENGGFTFRVSQDAPNGCQLLSNADSALHRLVEFQLTQDAAGNLIVASYTLAASKTSSQPEVVEQATRLVTDFVSLLDPEIDKALYSGMFVDAMKLLNGQASPESLTIMREYGGSEIQFSLIKLGIAQVMCSEIRPRRGEYE